MTGLGFCPRTRGTDSTDNSCKVSSVLLDCSMNSNSAFKTGMSQHSLACEQSFSPHIAACLVSDNASCFFSEKSATIAHLITLFDVDQGSLSTDSHPRYFACALP